MKVACVGGGPAGLYFSILMKLRDPSHDITVYERDPAGSTYGWGVTYWAGLLDVLRRHDPVSARAVADHSVRWSDGVAYVRDRVTVHHGDQGFGIGRHTLLDILARRAASLGVRVEFGHPVTGPADMTAPAAAEPFRADLVVAGDGANSRLRTRHAGHFGTDVVTGRNKYVWLGTTKVFDAFTFAFTETAHGWIWCYGYRYDEGRSTCVVECSPTTWTGLGLDRASHADGLALLGRLFAEPLDGHPLIGRPQPDGGARWLNFRTVTNRSWHRDNVVLLGDAAHTTHYSTGAGTTLALEDAVALAGALHAAPRLRPALARYEQERRAALVPAQSAARYSARWYENLPRYMSLEPSHMFALLGQRHSPLLPYVPPQLYYRIDRAAGRVEALRILKRRLGPTLARALHGRRPSGRSR
ncbi:FAD-dependent monooxygenase [Streptomyces lavendofoliae]|uniref:FAD-binding monooxygenase n=1 Tax=Streptomyces lavendofoliae TaxID=67314 RepID=A0A918I4G0_9ACTN|nr:FAD-dependent monooxygenase [Streptomyces lavendofoliae]GGU59095.1 FAD-binding monooxygenase [Streptomyces lavendofoliae]